MVRRVTDLERPGDEIADLMQSYQYQEETVKAYVAAVMSQSVQVNLYSTLLGRQGVYTAGRDLADSDKARQKEIERLAQYTIESLERKHDCGPGKICGMMHVSTTRGLVHRGVNRPTIF